MFYSSPPQTVRRVPRALRKLWFGVPGGGAETTSSGSSAPGMAPGVTLPHLFYSILFYISDIPWLQGYKSGKCITIMALIYIYI